MGVVLLEIPFSALLEAAPRIEPRLILLRADGERAAAEKLYLLRGFVYQKSAETFAAAVFFTATLPIWYEPPPSS